MYIRCIFYVFPVAFMYKLWKICIFYKNVWISLHFRKKYVMIFFPRKLFPINYALDILKATFIKYIM